MSDQLIVWKLIKSSNIFLEQAHKIGPYTVKSDKFLNKYNLLIKSCLNCYFKILRKFDSTLDLKTKATLYYKVSQLLFNETISLDIAFDYCNKGIQICKINESQLIILKWKLQFLNFQIQYKLNNNVSSKKSVLLYLNNLINEIPNYDENSGNNNDFFTIKIFFKFIKFKYFGMSFNSVQKNLTLKNLLNEFESNLNAKNLAFYNLLKLFQIQQLLLNNSSIGSITENFNELKETNSKFNREIKNLNLPIQLNAIEILVNILISIQNDSFNESKVNIKIIDNFIKNIKTSNLAWSNKISICLPLNEDLNTTFPIEFKWLSFKEFCSLSYFYCGISYIIKSWDGKNRTEKLFKFVENSTQNSLPLSYIETETNLLKMKYFKLLLNVYQILNEFNKNNYNETLFLRYPLILQFIRNYDNSKFSSQELIIYHNLIPLIFYLFAVVNQKNGNFKHAIFYYLKIKKLLSFNNELSPNFFFNDLIKISFLQDSMGISSNLFKSIGINNQLYYLSTLNLIVLVESYLNDFNLTNKDLSEFSVDYTKKMEILKHFLNFKNILILELNLINKHTFNSNNLLNYTLIILKKIFNNNDEFKRIDTVENSDTIDTSSNISNMDFDKIDMELINEKNIQSPMLLSMIYYIKGKNFKKNVYENDLININSNLKFFSISYSFALQLNNNDNDKTKPKNKLAYLSSFEIYSIMNSNKNYFKMNQINEVLKTLRTFSTESNGENNNENKNENNNENNKRAYDVESNQSNSKKKCIER